MYRQYGQAENWSGRPFATIQNPKWCPSLTAYLSKPRELIAKSMDIHVESQRPARLPLRLHRPSEAQSDQTRYPYNATFPPEFTLDWPKAPLTDLLRRNCPSRSSPHSSHGNKTSERHARPLHQACRSRQHEQRSRCVVGLELAF